LNGNAIKITETNFTELDWLCDEFGFTELATKLSQFRPSMDLKKAEEAETEDADAYGRIAVLEKRQINTPTSLRFWRTKSLNSP
jgi:hypothetical protein